MSKIRGLIAGFRVGMQATFRGLPAQPNTQTLAHGTVKEVANEVDYLGKTVNKRSQPCVEVAEIVDHCGPTARLYQREKTGSSRYIPTSGENRCRDWLSGYYAWLAAALAAEAEELAPPTILPDPDSWRIGLRDPRDPGETVDPIPEGDCPRGRQYQAPILGNCDDGYYREKSWGRDLCICEAGAAAETSFDKLGAYLSGNLKMVLIVIVVIVIGLVVMQVAQKKVSVG